MNQIYFLLKDFMQRHIPNVMFLDMYNIAIFTYDDLIISLEEFNNKRGFKGKSKRPPRSLYNSRWYKKYNEKDEELLQVSFIKISKNKIDLITPSMVNQTQRNDQGELLYTYFESKVDTNSFIYLNKVCELINKLIKDEMRMNGDLIHFNNKNPYIFTKMVEMLPCVSTDVLSRYIRDNNITSASYFTEYFNLRMDKFIEIYKVMGDRIDIFLGNTVDLTHLYHIIKDEVCGTFISNMITDKHIRSKRIYINETNMIKELYDTWDLSIACGYKIRFDYTNGEHITKHHNKLISYYLSHVIDSESNKDSLIDYDEPIAAFLKFIKDNNKLHHLSNKEMLKRESKLMDNCIGRREIQPHVAYIHGELKSGVIYNMEIKYDKRTQEVKISEIKKKSNNILNTEEKIEVNNILADFQKNNVFKVKEIS